MGTLDLLRLNLLAPMTLCFLLGAVARLIGSDLRLPAEAYTALSVYLLLAIGLKGGAALAATSPADLVGPVAATIALGVVIPVLTFAATRRRFGTADAAALAAHYGSVSAVTFIAAQQFLLTIGEPFEGFLPALVAILEVPAIVVGLLLARGELGRSGPLVSPSGPPAAGVRPGPAAPGAALAPRPLAPPRRGGLRAALHEILTGRSIVLLVGGMAIGAVVGPDKIAQVAPFFVEPFQGALCLFMLEMGLLAASRLGELRRVGAFLVVFALVAPVVFGTLGVLAGLWAGLMPGGATVLGAMAASASYIAAPAAVRLALPQANPSLYLTAAVGVTFPFNLSLGIPFYQALSRWLG